MRKIVSLMHMSLDGFAAGTKGEMDWIKMDDDVFAFVDTFIIQSDTGLYGAKTFGMMEAHWPKALKDPTASGHQLSHALWYSKAQKIVFSTTTNKLDDKNARLIKENPVAEIARLKNDPGKNIIIFGSPRLVHSFAQLNLIDEYVITINPVILGHGVPMFQGINSRIDLHLNQTAKFKAGSIGVHYSKV
jgi:dihydrofolate reductase